MKKTLLLLSLVSSLSSLAATSGWIETKQEIGNKLYNDFKAESTNFETKIKGEISVNDANLKAGGEFKLSGTASNTNNGNNADTTYKLNKGDSKIWAEYQLPNIQEVGSKIRVETNLDLNMKVQAEVFTTVEKVDYYAKAWYEGKQLFVTANKAQGELGFTNKGIEGFEYVGAKVFGGLTNIDKNKNDDYEVIAEAYGQYTGVKDFKLKFSGKGIYKHTKNDKNQIVNGYELQVKATPEYSKNNVSFIAEDSELFYNITGKYVKLVLKPEVKYTGIANTTLGTKVESLYEFETDKTKDWHVKPILFAQYKYMATDKLAIIPKGSIDLLIDKNVNNKTVPTTVTPSLKLEYKPVSGVSFATGAELPVTYNFKKGMNKTDIVINAKGQLEIKYEW